MKLDLKWLTKKPNIPTNITWGVPWPKGKINRDQAITLLNEHEEMLPHQTWPLAYWPDGSVKWTAHSANLSQEQSLSLSTDKVPFESKGLVVEEKKDKMIIRNGTMVCTVYAKGAKMLELEKDSQSYQGFLETLVEEREEQGDHLVISHTMAIGHIEQIELENKGEIRTVIKVKGAHYTKAGERFLPFIVRLSIYRDLSDLKIVHTIIHDSDPDRYYIKGIGLKITTSFTGEAWNRHVQMAGDEGVYSEPGQLLLTRKYRNADGLFKKQIENEQVNLDDTPDLKKLVKRNATWNDFKLIQDSAVHYKVMKRREKENAWIDVLHGGRSQGLLYAGGDSGGIAIGQKKFWQKFPSSLEVKGLTKDTSSIICWLWSPDSEAMDLRHYSNETHVESAYEGFEEMRASPIGIANTNELFLSLYSSTPSTHQLFEKALAWQNTNLLVCDPAYYYETKATGVWSLPDKSNEFSSFLERELEKALRFYRKEIDQRSWYGFWNYGDVMHTYDPVRHQWRYDLGGFAWQNTELAPNIWLWYAFLRSGDPAVFEMAEAMTRHTSEVDCYHLGEYKGLGSRHNVVHWGCGCKEARISMANLYKTYYYLTADERTGEILKDFKDADEATVKLDPMREFYPKDEHPTHTRVGPDWAAFCSNWLCEWERSEDKSYFQKIITGIEDIKSTPFRLLSGPTYGYNPETSHLFHIGDGNKGGFHMIIAFGAPQVWMELAELLDDEVWKEMLAEFGEFYALSDQEKQDRTSGILHNKMFNWPMFSAAMIAYAARRKKNHELAQTAWRLLLDPKQNHTPLPIVEHKVTSWKTLNEIPWVTTNTISQWSINVIVCLELLKDYPPKSSLQKSIKSEIK